MIEGLVMSPPVIGRISIGKLVQRNNQWLPEKDDSFTLTTQIKHKGEWLLHPLHQQLVEQQTNGKIRSIPVRMLFNETDLNLRAQYSAFDRKTGRVLCMGNGQQAKRHQDERIETVPCVGPEYCPYARQYGCKLYGRLNVQIEGQADELGSFIFRTTGYNSVRTLAARLRYLQAVSDQLTRYLPLQLKLRTKSTTLSHQTPVYYVDLTLRDGLTLPQAVREANQLAAEEREAGLQIAAFEQTAMALLDNGQFEETEEEVPLVMEEFYPDPPSPGKDEPPPDNDASAINQPTSSKTTSATSSSTHLTRRNSPLTTRLGQPASTGTT